jgi:hypothetical protein
MFPATSRYHKTEIVQLTTPTGDTIAYLKRRFLPLTQYPTLAEHGVIQSDRLDNLTYDYLGDPEQFWRIADHNQAMNPHNLTAPERVGKRLSIPLIQGE